VMRVREAAPGPRASFPDADWRQATSRSASEGPARATPFERLAALSITAQSARCYGDLAGCALVVRGKAEAWFEAGVQIWEHRTAARPGGEAGGRFTDLDGRATHTSGIASRRTGWFTITSCGRSRERSFRLVKARAHGARR